MNAENAVLGYMNFPGIYLRDSVDDEGSEAFNTIHELDTRTFMFKTRNAILTLALMPNGKALLARVCSRLLQLNQSICIEPAAEFSNQKGSGWDEKTNVLRWYPGVCDDSSDLDQLYMVPAFIILGHELIHAMHSLENDVYPCDSEGSTTAVEESRTIGLGPWAGEPLTENGLRSEWRIRRQTTFGGANAHLLLRATEYG